MAFLFASVAGNFNPRSPCGERPALIIIDHRQTEISIHAPRAGSDPRYRLPRPALQISIHAPRAGSDFPWPTRLPPPFDFNPRSPCGERLQLSCDTP